MKIAIVSSLNYHIECVGFLIASLADDDNIITLFVPKVNTYGYETYFHKLYNANFTIKDIKEFKAYTKPNFDLIYKLTANDPVKTPLDKTISIVHKSNLSDRSSKKIVLSPYVKLNPEPTMVTPVYQGLIRHHTEIKKEILWIGQLEDSWIDEDLLKFIENVNFHFTFVISAGRGRGSKLKKLRNVTVINSLATDKMIELILNCDLILCRKFPFQRRDRFSGVITLGLSHDKPMIMNEEMADDYKIPAITFKKDYSELSEYINKINIGEINKHINNIVSYRNKTIISNKTKINAMINQKQ